jgi:hypothetical protein
VLIEAVLIWWNNRALASYGGQDTCHPYERKTPVASRTHTSQDGRNQRGIGERPITTPCSAANPCTTFADRMRVGLPHHPEPLWVRSACLAPCTRTAPLPSPVVASTCGRDRRFPVCLASSGGLCVIGQRCIPSWDRFDLLKRTSCGRRLWAMPIDIDDALETRPWPTRADRSHLVRRDLRRGPCGAGRGRWPPREWRRDGPQQRTVIDVSVNRTPRARWFSRPASLCLCAIGRPL